MPSPLSIIRRLVEESARKYDKNPATHDLRRLTEEDVVDEFPMLSRWDPSMADPQFKAYRDNNRLYGHWDELIEKFGIEPPAPLYRGESALKGDLRGFRNTSPTARSQRQRSFTEVPEHAFHFAVSPSSARPQVKFRSAAEPTVIEGASEGINAVPQLFTGLKEWIYPSSTYFEKVPVSPFMEQELQRLRYRDKDAEALSRLEILSGRIKRASGGLV